MLTLARQHPDLRHRDHLDRIYDGLRTEYRHYVRRSDFSTLDELMSLTDDFEALKSEERPQPAHLIATRPYERRRVCWRCKEEGHYRATCINDRKLFCSYCGRDGTLTRNCDCRKIIKNERSRFPLEQHQSRNPAAKGVTNTEVDKLLAEQKTEHRAPAGFVKSIQTKRPLGIIAQKTRRCVKRSLESVFTIDTDANESTKFSTAGIIFVTEPGHPKQLRQTVKPPSNLKEICEEMAKSRNKETRGQKKSIRRYHGLSTGRPPEASYEGQPG